MTDRTLTKREVDANVAKTMAETEKYAAEARKANAEALSHEINAEAIGIERDRAIRNERAELAKDEHHHVYVFDTEVSEVSVTKCLRKLAEWSRNDPECAIEIIFNSPGGSIIDGLALYDYLTQIKARGHLLTTSTLGMAASMAGILLQAGTTRKMGPESWLLIHEASFGTGGSMGQVEDRVEWIKKIQERILAIFAAKSDLTKAQIKLRWSRKDWWLDADEALKLGFIDEIG